MSNIEFETNSTELIPIVESRPEYDSNPITYRTFSGTDITATILVPNESRPLVLGDLQTLSYSIHREAKPVRMLGNVNPLGFVGGPRTIAGSMVFINFESYTFYRLEQFRKLIAGSQGVIAPNTITSAPPMYALADMLPLFDIVITASNEYGSFSKMKIIGVQVVDEGGTMSIEDLVTESQYTFMARSIEPWTPFYPNNNTVWERPDIVGAIPRENNIPGNIL